MLEVRHLVAGYTEEPVVRDVSLRIAPGQVVSLIGANGAGKTSTLRAIVGALRPRGGEVAVDGEIRARPRPLAMLRSGVVLVPEGRGVFAGLSVRENLQLGEYGVSGRRGSAAIEEVLELFPRLRERAHVSGALLSGGEQQMLAIARALMARPRFLLLDEPSMGLAPKAVAEVGQIIRREVRRGMGILLVEQNAKLALDLADHALILERGRVVLEGTGPELADTEQLRTAYFGLDKQALVDRPS